MSARRGEFAVHAWRAVAVRGNSLVELREITLLATTDREVVVLSRARGGAECPDDGPPRPAEPAMLSGRALTCAARGEGLQ